jgi:hypothetical protein
LYWGESAGTSGRIDFLKNHGILVSKSIPKRNGGRFMNEKLYQLLQKAELDFELRKRIWAAKDAKDPALALCELCTAEGFPLTVGQLFSEQEEFFCNLFRSCNGSAVDPLDGWDDPFEMFFAALEALDKK